MKPFATHKQTIAKIYTDEAKLLEVNIAQCKELIQRLVVKYNEDPQEWHLTQQNNLSIEIEKDKRRLESCVAISNWLLGITIETENDN